jgi:uncharacterized protein YdiU (UPF0061 family)
MAAAPYRPDPQFLALAGPPFSDPVAPADFPQTVLRWRNDRIAETVGLRLASDREWIDKFALFKPLANNLPTPLALRYHGHQFRTYNPDLGDGRGFLYAQMRDGAGRLLDLATKGSGKTPYSRTADGRLTLKGGVRELLATEMLEALGVYTSKTFSVIETGESLVRHDEPSPTRACVLVRLGHGHIRFGMFQRLAYEQDAAAMRALVGYCQRCFEPDLRPDATIAAWFSRIVWRTARLVAQWMAAGFVHGVLNTDNMNVTGESFDYGPWRFLPRVDFGYTAAYFDQTGLYAYGRQPDAGLWNLSRFGGALALIEDETALNAALSEYPAALEAGMIDAFHKRLGLSPLGDGDFDFIVALLQWMEKSGVPFERVFFDWFCGALSTSRAAQSPNADLYSGEDFAPLREALSNRAPIAPERLAHPYFAGAPETMLIEEVEAIWEPIAAADDWAPLRRKIDRIAVLREALSLDASRFATPG